MGGGRWGPGVRGIYKRVLVRADSCVLLLLLLRVFAAAAATGVCVFVLSLFFLWISSV